LGVFPVAREICRQVAAKARGGFFARTVKTKNNFCQLPKSMNFSGNIDFKRPTQKSVFSF